MSALSFRGGAALVAALALVACARREPATRDSGVLAHAVPRRIASLGPSGTEILVALGAYPRLVGRSRWDTWPDTVRTIPELGDAIRPSVERIIAARPDLVVLYAAADNRAAGDALAAAGVRVVSLRIDTIDDFLRAVDSLGTLVGERTRADSIVGAVRGVLDSVRAQPRAVRPRVFIPVWDEPLMTVGTGSFLSELVAIAGGENVYADAPQPSLTVSLEDVVRRDPDVVLTSPRGAERFATDPRWRVLRAAREGRVATYDTLLVSQPSTRLGAAARSLAAALHPGNR